MVLLFLGACLGHVALMIAGHNWWYGLPLPRKAGDVIHLSFGLLTIVFPLAMLAHYGWSPAGLFELSAAPWTQKLLAGYVILCVIVGFCGIPLNTLRRLLRREPVIEKRSAVLNVEKALGRPPAGENWQRHLTSLPGNQVFEVELVERTLRLPRLPAAWDGLTVLHLSDLHLNGTPDRDFFRVVMDRCAEWQPDLVCVTGDIADSTHHQRWIVPVLGRLRWRVAGLAILGNHDYWYDPPFIRRRLRRIGLQVLSNTWQQLEVRGEPLIVIGNESPWLRPAPDLSRCPTEPFRLCLSHTPDNIRWARRARIDLMLSGHVHGGQCRVPLFGSLLVPSRYGRRYDCGTFAEGPTLLQVSRGLSGDHPLRYLCRPEVTLLTLRCPVAPQPQTLSAASGTV